MKIRYSLLLSSLFALNANAAVISPISVDDLNADTFTGGGPGFAAINLINGAHAATLADAPGGTGNWVSNDPAPGGGDYFVDSAVPPILSFDLGADTPIDAIHVWAYTNGTGAPGTSQGNSLADFNIRFAAAAEGPLGFGTSITDNPGFTASPSTPTDGGPQPVQTFNFTSVTARYVELTVTDNYFGAPSHLGGDRVGIAEVAFNQVPEPSSAALLGLGGLALILRRHKG